MEIDVTHMVEDAESLVELSGSRVEHGQDAGRITWNNSKEYGAEHPLLTTDDMRDAARAHFRAYGAWSEEEITAWAEEDLQAITCQDVAAAIREMEAYKDHADYLERDGRVYQGDDKHWYFYLGS